MCIYVGHGHVIPIFLNSTKIFFQNKFDILLQFPILFPCENVMVIIDESI